MEKIERATKTTIGLTRLSDHNFKFNYPYRNDNNEWMWTERKKKWNENGKLKRQPEQQFMNRNFSKNRIYFRSENGWSKI